ncbi:MULTISPECIES: alpha/beta fold hydrolase [unclassified Spirosoma]|uniref:alpha/beta hydrolase n=1 Tax=unclassified Spirosoma TaxID=2621999 RepID=UPI0009620964|nr:MULTISPECIES: alpha/beta fold hydrolase [unclassified Spirosoma]MBN8821796.1 alpha/beta fold hydrolase [Spirosoma sp.]OJW80714.1 MAG: alpha/beta hydrolase [Spirosoma sp. 48-14]
MVTKKRWFKRAWIGLTILLLYIGIYLFLYVGKDEQINRYRSTPLPDAFRYTFSQHFEELTIQTPKAGSLNALLFKAPQAKGVVCFWKGNGGNLANWGAIAPTFLQFNYDVLISDYRQHGKSKGAISLTNFYSDAQTVYDSLAHRYPPDEIVICGYSLGGRVAAHLAASNRPKFTILIDPASAGGDFSDRFTDLVYFPLPSVNGFTFHTEEDVQKASRPVVIISTDNVHSTAYKLQPYTHTKDQFVAVAGATHETILTYPQTKQILERLLMKP